MNHPRPGAWLEPAAALRRADELATALADLRMAAAHATGLPPDTPTAELAAALNQLDAQEDTP